MSFLTCSLAHQGREEIHSWLQYNVYHYREVIVETLVLLYTYAFMYEYYFADESAPRANQNFRFLLIIKKRRNHLSDLWAKSGEM